jgi:hypothetical protein
MAAGFGASPEDATGNSTVSATTSSGLICQSDSIQTVANTAVAMRVPPRTAAFVLNGK